MKQIRYTLLLLVCCLLPGCIEEFEANISSDDVGCLVVEGNIISDSTVTFYLSRTVPLVQTFENEEEFNNYKNVKAQVSVKGSDGSSWQGVGLGEGAYEVAIGTLSPEAEYHLEIIYEDETYTSEPQRPLATSPIEELSFKQATENDNVIIVLSTTGQEADGAEYYYWNYEEDWELRAEYQCATLVEYDTIVKELVVKTYDYPPYGQGWGHNVSGTVLLGTTETNTGNFLKEKQIYTLPRSDNRLSFLYTTLFTQRNLSKGEYEYYQARKQYSEEMGGLFTPQPSELPTNITCNNGDRTVIGYVGCNMNVSQVRLWIPTDSVFYGGGVNCKFEDTFGRDFVTMYYDGFQIAYEPPPYNPLGIRRWAKVSCCDVRRKGGKVDARPDWWPNPYLYK